MKKKNFSDINQVFYSISKHKQILTRKIRDCLSKDKFAKIKSNERLPKVISEYNSVIIKKGPGIDPQTQENKSVNIRLASSTITNILIKPGEIFSFWKVLGIVNKRKGYKEGRVIRNNKLIKGTGGGLCNLANTINNLILRSSLEIVEFHKHSDALASDIGHRKVMANGTSVSYNYIDYRFKNNTNKNVQLILWCDEEKLYGELRSEEEAQYNYDIIEENHHFKKIDEKVYRISQIYKVTLNKSNNEVIKKELIWDNKSLVMFDINLIPTEMIQ